MSTEINHTSACFNLWRQPTGRFPNTGGEAAEAKRRVEKFSLGSLQAAASEFITELAVRVKKKKRHDRESWLRGRR